jgi:outer membrane protein TolC
LRLSIQQPIFTGFRIQSSKDMAEFNSLSSMEDYNKDKSDLIFNIKNTFFNLLKLQKVLYLISENIKQVESHLRDIKNFYEKGLSDKNDVLKTEVQLSNVKVTYLETENLVKISKLNLCNLIGINLSLDIDIQDIRLDSAYSINSLEHYLNVACTNRADLKSTDYKVRMAESNVKLAGSNWFPQVFLSANYTYANPNQRIMPALKEFKDTWDIGVSLSFDIWNWGLNSAKVDQASSQLNEVQNGLSQLKDGVILDVNQSYLTVLQSREKILYTQKALEQGEENYRIALEKFSKGLLSNSEMLDAEVILLQVKVNNTNAIIDYQIALAKLEKSIGK